MEAEYSKIPITIIGKSLHMKKRKEELEYELDLVEKYISRVNRGFWMQSAKLNKNIIFKFKYVGKLRIPTCSRTETEI